MRATFSIFLSALLFCGCSQKHTAYVDESVDIVAGKDIVVRDYVISVKKRQGSSIEGVRIVHREPDGKETTITADTGTLTQGPKQSVEAQPTDAKTKDRLRVVVIYSPVKMTLHNPLLISEKAGRRLSTVTMEKLDIGF
jgi:hypothetical protein